MTGYTIKTHHFKTRNEAVENDFNFAGTCNDVSMKDEIIRDYAKAGYSEMAFVTTRDGYSIFYYTKHPQINP